MGAAVIEEAKAHFSSAVVLYREPLSARALHAMGRTMVTDEMVSGITGRFSQAVFACEMSGIFDRLMGRSGL